MAAGLRQMPRAAAFDQKELDVLRFGQRNADRLERLARRLEVEMLGVDEDAVVVPEDRVDGYGLVQVKLAASFGSPAPR